MSTLRTRGSMIAISLITPAIREKMNPTVSGSWKIDDFTNAVYVTIIDPRFGLVYNYQGLEAAPQSDSFEFVPKQPGTYIMRFSTKHISMVSRYGKLTVVLEWNEIVTRTTEHTEDREVTKYRQVPVEVEKQRTVTEYERISLWKLFF